MPTAAIDLKECIGLIRTGQRIQSIRAFTADINKGSGGKLIELLDCKIARKDLMDQENTKIKSDTGNKKNADHNLNFTLNMQLRNNQIRKIHPILITHINNMPVL